VVLDRHGQPPDAGVERRPLGDRPRAEHLAELDPQVEVQGRRVVHLHHEPGRRHGTTLRPGRQTSGPRLRLYCVDPVKEVLDPPAGADSGVTALYQSHAVGLVRLAVLMLGDQSSAEDVVQEAFLGLYRNWDKLRDRDRAVPYVRSSVVNGCRDVLRRRSRKVPLELLEPDAASAEVGVLLAEEHQEVLVALRRLPLRQREAVVLRYCLAWPEDEVARSMNVSRGTVKSSSHRGLAALARILKEDQ
jgi:RNA polymerase sigma-70 factor (sigma-E family)